MFNEKEMKLWRLALDPGAMKGEYENAIVLILNSLRARNFKPEDLSGVKPQPQQQHYRPRQDKQTHWGTTKMPFGKYKGEMLQDIDIDYLHWVMGWIHEDDGRLQKFSWLVTTIENYLEN
jgi:uncharacterized protein (DUF3820 family)